MVITIIKLHTKEQNSNVPLSSSPPPLPPFSLKKTIVHF